MCDWNGYLSRGFDADLVECIRNKVLDAAISEIKPPEIVSETGIAEEDVMEFLKLLANEEDVLEIKQRLRCPFCGELIKGDIPANGHYCEAEEDFVDTSDLETEDYFELNADSAQSIRWAVVIHGMNTRGPWQEDLVWRLSHIKKYAIPVYVYKYGLVRIGVTLGFLQKLKVNKLVKQLRNISKAADPGHSGLRPHVIAHSFGTWLIAHALKEHPDIKIGRLILLGSIVRPDFDWMKLINDKQVEAILNHTAGKDKPVRFSQLFIPDSGPGGRVGFLEEEVINIRSPEFGHSGYFKRNRMAGYLSKDGVWARFLQRPLSSLQDTFDDQFECAGWKPIWCILRTFVRYLTLLTVIGIAGFLCYTLYRGIVNIF